MLLELGVVGGLVGLFMARNTKPVKAVINSGKNLLMKSKMAQSLVLSNAKDTIKNEFNSEKENLREDIISLEVDKRSFDKKKEYIEFLNYALNDDEVSNEEKQQLEKEKEIKETEINILSESIKQKEVAIEQRSKSLEQYKNSVLDKRISEAEIAEVVFRQQNDIDKLQKKLENVETLGENTLTNSIVSKYASGGVIKSNISIGKRYELMERYKKSK